VWTQEPWGRALRCTRLPVRHLFTSRDVELRDSRAEWTAVAASLGVTLERLRLVRQVHGTTVAVVRRGDIGAQQPEADAIVTDDPEVAVGVRVADCASILLVDPLTGAVGAAHAGWRGTAARIASVVVGEMNRTFGSRAADLLAAIGPCLGVCCGEVGPEVVEAFRMGGASGQELRAWFAAAAGDRSLLDLERSNGDQLRAAGVHSSRIFTAGVCTKTHADRLHSYRASKAGAGRLLAAIRAVGH